MSETNLQEKRMLYALRDPAEQNDRGGYFSRHLYHMTAEKLWSKAEIAGELAHRDIVLADALKVIEQLLPGVGGLVVDIGHMNETLMAISALEVEE